MNRLIVTGPCVERELELSREELAALPAEHQIPDVGELVEGRAGSAVRLWAVAELAGARADARFVHVASEDESFTANLDVEDARRGALVLYALDGEPLPRRFGGPFRLLFVDSSDCSVNVKFLGRVELVQEPGSHTARCSD